MVLNKKIRKSNIAGFSQLLSKRFDQFSIDYWPKSYISAKGTMIQCNDGNWYKDLSISGIGACIFGYADDEVDESVIQVIKNGVATSLNSDLEEEVAELLLEFIPEHSYVRYAKGGGEAMSIAVRIARAHTNKSKILFSGYHGWSDWYLAANLTNQSNLNNHLIKDLAPIGVPKELQGTSIPFDYGDIDDLLEKFENHNNEIACIVMEPARSNEADAEYLQSIYNLAKLKGIPLIFDEISCGFRQSKGPYSKKFNVVPDIYVFAKSIGNGYPIAAITGRSEIMNGFNSSFVSSTNWSEAIGLGAARSVLKKFQKSSPHEKIIELGECWANTIQKECESNKFMIDISGLPGMKYFSHTTDSDLFRTFFTVFALQENILVAGRYYPNTSQTIQDIKQYGELLNNAIVKYQSMSRSDIEKFTGKVMPGGFNSLEKILE